MKPLLRASALLLAVAVLAPMPLRAAADALAVRFALVVGNRGEAPLPTIGEVLAEPLMKDYLTQWDPGSDNPEIRRLFALRGLSEVTRQAARLQPAGGTLAGAARIGNVRWRVDVDVTRQGEVATFAARIYRNDELVSAPQVRSAFGEKAIVSSTSEEDATFLFVVVQADDWSRVAARQAGGSAPAPPRAVPKAIHKVSPDYPESERASRVEGVVVLALRVDKSGQVSDARVVRSLGKAFDEAAVEAVRQWRFEPLLRDGQPTESEINITINFVPGAASSGR